ncbi:MAG: hypothetical protein AB7F22_14450, partial [Reyranella sp.]
MRSPARRGRCLFRLQRDARAVGDAGDGIETGDDGGRVHHRWLTEAINDRIARLVKVRCAVDHRIGESEQRLLRGNAAGNAIGVVALNDAGELVVLAAMPAARPEQGQMAGRSIDALVANGHAGGKHLDLGMLDGTV